MNPFRYEKQPLHKVQRSLTIRLEDRLTKKTLELVKNFELQDDLETIRKALHNSLDHLIDAFYPKIIPVKIDTNKN